MKKLFPFIVFISFACSRETISLTNQKVVMELTHEYNRKPHLYYPITEERFDFRNDNQVRIGGFKWANTSDQLTGIAYKQDKKYGTVGGNILLFTREGVVADTLYAGTGQEIPANAYLSGKDSLLLFTSHVRPAYDPGNPLIGLSAPTSLFVMAVASEKIILQKDSIASYLQLSMHESPWLPDGQRFIYSITRNRVKVSKNPSLPPSVYNPLSLNPGIYLHNLASRQDTLIIENGRFAICSPTENKIAFLRDRRIWLLDLDTQTTKLLYKSKKILRERIIKLHWTPDGQYVYAASYTWWDNDEKLIRIKDATRFNVSTSIFGLSSWK